MSAPADYKFEAWSGVDASAAEGNLTRGPYEPKVFEDHDIDVAIQYCGICGTDPATLRGEMGEFAPIVPGRVCGHEMVGRVVRTGPKVENDIKVGDIVGIGTLTDSCRECEPCKTGKPQYCLKTVVTYMSPFNKGPAAGKLSQGGFSTFWRGPSTYAIPVPKGLDPALAAPLLCGGLTVYSPLKRYGAGTKSKRVGIVGIGGLGHMGILVAKALGAEVTAISRGNAKEEDAKALGADHYYATSGQTEAEVVASLAPHARTLDLIIMTINPPKLHLDAYIQLLRPEGTLVVVGVIQENITVNNLAFILGSYGLAFSNSGTPTEVSELFNLVAKSAATKPWINRWRFDNISEAFKAFNAGKPRFRFVLVNEDNGGKLEA